MTRYDVSDEAVLWSSPDGEWVEYSEAEELLVILESIVNHKTEMEDGQYSVGFEAIDAAQRVLEKHLPQQE